MENQVLGLAEAVAAGGGVEVVAKRAALAPARAWMPEALLAAPISNPLAHLAPSSDSLSEPWPQILIGCGRVAAGLSVALRRAADKAGHEMVTVQTQDPRISPAFFDLVVPPAHDGLRGANIMPILGSPNRVTPKRLETEAGKWRGLTDNLPRPLIAVLIGGSSHAYEFTEGAARRLCSQLLKLRDEQGCGLIITASRRTGPTIGKLLRDTLKGDGIWFWDDQGDNPYFGMLALADHIIVTSDSINMATEAAATGKPIHIFHLPGGGNKLARFHRSMETRGLARPFKGDLPTWSYEPLHEAARVAVRIRELVGAHGAALVPTAG